MTARNSESAYGWVARWLHWVIAALIISQFVLGQLAEAAAENDMPVRQLALLANHKSVGITVLLLALVRLCWRWASPVPELPAGMPRWQVLASRVSHWLLYLLIFALPISGWIMSSASAYTVSWFNLFELPDLVDPSETLKQRMVDVHHLLAATLFFLAVVHVLAALKHQFFDHDGVLGRMLSAGSIAAFMVVLAGTIWAATDVQAVRDAAAPPPDTAEAAGSVAVSTVIAPWQIDYAASHIRFTAEQAGARFSGEWPNWRGDIRFSPAALEHSSAVVEIDVASVSTGDGERDGTLLSGSWFAADTHPTVRFAADDFTPNDDGTFTATADLTVKHTTTPVELRFSLAVDDTGQRHVLDGSARLDRLALQLGTGEWADTSWVGQFVDVSVHVEAPVQP